MTMYIGTSIQSTKAWWMCALKWKIVYLICYGRLNQEFLEYNIHKEKEQMKYLLYAMCNLHKLKLQSNSIDCLYLCWQLNLLDKSNCISSTTI